MLNTKSSRLIQVQIKPSVKLVGPRRPAVCWGWRTTGVKAINDARNSFGSERGDEYCGDDVKTRLDTHAQRYAFGLKVTPTCLVLDVPTRSELLNDTFVLYLALPSNMQVRFPTTCTNATAIHDASDQTALQPCQITARDASDGEEKDNTG